MEVQSGNDRMSAPSTAAWPRPAHEDPAVWVPARVPPGARDRRPARLERVPISGMVTLWARTGKRSKETRFRTGARVRFPSTTSRFPDATSLTEDTYRRAGACPGHSTPSGRDRRRSGDLTLFRSDFCLVSERLADDGKCKNTQLRRRESERIFAMPAPCGYARQGTKLDRSVVLPVGSVHLWRQPKRPAVDSEPKA